MSSRTAVRSDLPPWAAALAVLLTVTWVLATPYLWLASVFSVTPFLGEPPSDAERAEALRLAVGTAVVGVGGPAVVLGLAVGFGRRALAVAAGLAALLGLLAGLTVLAAAWPASTDPPVREDRPRGCVEFSGGPSDCP